MIGFREATEIHLDAARFSNDEEIYAVAIVIKKHAENRRANYRETERPIKLGLLEVEGYWSDSVPWYEWMTEPQVLQPCAQECGLKIWQLAEVIAHQISPRNWQVFSWMYIALQGREYEELITGALSRQTAQIGGMLEKSRFDERLNLAKTGALAKLAADPKQKDKAMVRECWDAWQKQPDRYRGKAAFARDMLDKFENLESQPVIERWCREWGIRSHHPASTIVTLPAK